jgi:hypothetical protein
MNIFTYWESFCPFVIKRSLRSISEVFGDDHIHLTSASLGDYVELPPRIKAARAVAWRSDYLRAALLHKFGGIWLDADIILLRDFRNMIRVGTPMVWQEGGFPRIDASKFRARPELCIGIIYSPPKHPIVRTILTRFDQATKSLFQQDGQPVTQLPRYAGQRLWRDAIYECGTIRIGETKDFHAIDDATKWYQYWDGAIRMKDIRVGAHWFYSAHQNDYTYRRREILKYPQRIKSLKKEEDVIREFPDSLMADYLRQEREM